MLSSQQLSYLRWLCLPDEYRKLTEDEMRLLLLGPEGDLRTFGGWKRSKEFQRAYDRRLAEQQESSDFLSYAMREQTKQQIWHEFKLLSEKKRKDKDDHNQLRQYAKQMLEFTEHVEDAGNDIPPYEEMPDDELVKLFLDSGLCLATASQTELKAYLEGESCKNSSEASSEPSSSPSDSTQDGSTVTEPVAPEESRPSPSPEGVVAPKPSTASRGTRTRRK